MTDVKRILVVRLGAMGDILHAMPAVSAIRAASPDCMVDWVVEKRWTELLSSPGTDLEGTRSEYKPYVDRIITVDTRGWRKSLFSSSTWSSVRTSLAYLRKNDYDLVLDFQGAIKSAVLGSLSRNKAFFGFASPRERQAAFFYSRKVAVASKHVIDQNVELASHALLQTLAAADVSLPVDRASAAWAEGLVAAERFAILIPGAGWAAKQWPVENFAAVARSLRDRGIRSLINFGPGEENIASRLQQLSEGTAEPVRCTLSQMISLTRRATLVIGGDTGPTHLAAALGIPVVALFGPTDPERNGPYGTRAIVLRDAKSTTSYKHVSDADAGLANIAPEQVLAAAEKLIG